MLPARLFSLAALALCVIPSDAPAQRPVARDTIVPATTDSTYKLPLKPSRKARFTVDEATWMSLDVSPDGRTIIFDLLGDLYTLPIGGGKATRLMGGMAMDVQPRYSPNGKQIVFVSDRTGNDQIWVADADGRNPKQITRPDDARPVQPMWTPDGEYIVANGLMYHRDGGTGVPIIGASAGGGGRGAPPNPNAPTGGAYAFTPDGRYMYYSVQVTGGRGAALPAQDALQRYQIAVLDRKTGQALVRTHEYGGAFKPMISPDGRSLVYGTRVDAKTGLRLRDLVTGDERWLVPDYQHDAAERNSVLGILPNAAFTPDGSALIGANKGKLWRIATATGTATPIPFSADVDLDLGSLTKFAYTIPDSFVVRQIRDAVPSPDGKVLAFTALDKLYTLDLTCGQRCEPLRVSRGSVIVEQSPAWSPDGRYLAYATWDDAKGGDVYRVPSPKAPGGGMVTQAADPTPEKLTRIPALYTRLQYTPAGDRIVFMHASRRARAAHIDNLSGSVEVGMDLSWMPAGGGDTHVITMLEEVGTASGVVAPHFVAGDSDRVYFNSSGVLASIRFDGTDRRTVVRVPGTTILSPSGDRALNLGAIGSWSIYTFNMPRIGNESLTVNIGAGASAVPLRLVSRTGGEFGGWAPDGRSFYYSLGHSFFRYDMAVGDSLARASDARRAGDTTSTRRATSAYAGDKLDVNIRVARDRAGGTVVLRGARIITMKGSEVIPSGDVVVVNDRITAVGPSGRVTIPAGARTIDVSGKTIIPGYIDIHAHMWPPWAVHKTQVPQYYENLAWGVTTVRDPQTSSSDVITYADRQAVGEIIGPRYLSTGPGVFSRDEIKSLEEAREHLRRYGTDFWNTQTLKQYLAGDRKTRQNVIMAAKELGLTPTTEGAGDFKMSISEMIDGYAGHEHAYEIYPLYADVAKLAAISGIVYTPTLVIAYGGPTGREYFFSRENPHDDPKIRRFWFHPELDHRVMRRSMWGRDSEYVFWGVAAGANRFVKEGAPTGLGSHGEFQGLGAHWELWMFQMGGMANHDVLRVGTIFGAEAIGLDKDLGSIEVGKLADLQVLDKNPLENIRNTNTIKYVMQNGRLFDGNTLDQIWPLAKKAGPFWWSEPPSS